MKITSDNLQFSVFLAPIWNRACHRSEKLPLPGIEPGRRSQTTVNSPTRPHAKLTPIWGVLLRSYTVHTVLN